MTAIVKHALEADFEIPSPDGHGWSIVDGKLSIVWILLPPAPDDVLQLVSCNCKKSACKKGNCNCLSFKLQCTDLCGCGDVCQNRENDQDDSDDDSDDDENDFDDDEHDDETEF